MNTILKKVFFNKKLIYKSILPWIENIVLGLAVFWLNDQISLNFDIRILYIMVIGLIYGAIHSMFSATLSIAIVIYFTYQNNQFESEVNIEIFKMFILFFFVAIVSGFSKTNISIELKALKQAYSQMESDNNNLKKELSNTRDAAIILGEQLKTSEQSYGRLYKIIKTLECIETNQILDRIPEFIEELTGFDKSVLYIINDDGDEKEIFRYKPTDYVSMSSQEILMLNEEILNDVIEKKKVYINSKMKTGIPDAIIPIKNLENNVTYGIIAILEIPFNKMNQYTLQMLNFSGELLSDYLTKSIIKNLSNKQDLLYE